MRFGLALPHYGFSFPDGGPLEWERLSGYARRAEALGFDSIWISDHFFLDLARYGGPDDPHAAAEPFTSLRGGNSPMLGQFWKLPRYGEPSAQKAGQ